MTSPRPRLLARLIPTIVASLALLAHAGLMYKAALRHTGGAISFPVDDTFIHLALAKQIALSGVYGVTPHEFAAASSSIGWPLILAVAIKVLGAKAWLPLLLNAGFAVALLLATDMAVRRIAPAASTLTRTLVCLAVMIFTPMATLVVLGMEHTVHAAATIAFVVSATTWLGEGEGDAEGTKGALRRALPVAAWAAATTSWRYEGMFVVALVVGLALLRRRIVPGALVAVGGALPIVLFGMYSKANGAHFLPVPVLLKGRHFDVTDSLAWSKLLGGDLIDRFTSEGYALALAVAAAGLAFHLIRRDGFWTTNVLALVLTLGMIILHLELASVGWFFRYESYLLATGVAVIGATLARLLPTPRELWRVAREQKPRTAAAVLGALVLLAPVVRRIISANEATPLACRNIHEQQMQTARFLAAQFPHQRVAVNDIGAVAWLDNDRVLDLMGLASISVAEAKKMKLDEPMKAEDVVRLTEGVKVAVVYDEWFKDNLPPTWLRVGRWKIADNKSCAFPTVAVYATEPAQFPLVIEALRTFAPELPRGLGTEGRYTEQPGTARLRSGDRIVVSTSSTKVSGAYLVEADGTVVLYGFGPVRVRGLSPDEAPAAMQKIIDDLPSKLLGTKIEKVTRVAPRPPLIQVAGAVKSPGEVPAMPLTLDAAIGSAGPIDSADTAAAWVWRESAGTFARMTRDQLTDGALVDGDIVVVPSSPSPAAPPVEASSP